MAEQAEIEQHYKHLKSHLMRVDLNGQSVYDHLHSIMLDTVENNTTQKPERFAEMSSQLMDKVFIYGDKNKATNENASSDQFMAARAADNMALYQSKPKPTVETKIERITPFKTVTTTVVKDPTAPPFSSVASQNRLWRQCGYGLPDEEAFRLDQSISKLAKDKNLDDIRFFGKFFGTQGDYLVVQSRRFVDPSDSPPLAEVNTIPKPPRKGVSVDMQPEPGYKGCNRFSFWVTSHAAGSWTLLPDTTPQQLNATRKCCKLLSGCLETKLQTYPDFGWSETVYLRALLSRILAGCSVAPSGAVEQTDDFIEEDDLDEDEDGPVKPKLSVYHPPTKAVTGYGTEDGSGPVEIATLTDLESWQHTEPCIFLNGRQTAVPDKPPAEDEEEEVEDDDEEEKEPEEEPKELLLPLKQDALYAVIDIPQEPNPEEDDEEIEPEDEDGGEAEEEEEPPTRVYHDEDVDDDDPAKKKITSWTVRQSNTNYRKHSLCVLKSMRWPGALAYAAEEGKKWGCVYFGNGLKKTDISFTPLPASIIQKEASDILEVPDATAANEKLVLWGEQPKEEDSEDENDDEEEEN